MRHSIPAIICLMLFTTAALAQDPASDFRQLGSRLAIGETIRVRDNSSVEFKGRLSGLSASELALTIAGSPRTFNASQIRQVWHLEKDPVANGVFIGLAAGIGAGLLAPAGFCSGFNDSECSAIVRVVFVPIGAGAGAVTGWLVDLAMKRSVLVFSATGSGAASLRVTPIVSPHKTGIGLSLRF